MPSTHGGDLFAASLQYSGELLDFSVNVNPLGPCPAAVAAAEEALRHCERYPDPLCRELKRAIAAREGAEPEDVLCTSGASELIFRLVQALRPGEALVTAPAFSEYERALESVGCAVRRHRLWEAENFDVTGRLLDELTGEMELLFLCTPNNPTGRLLNPALLEALLRRCRELGALLVLDECFLELSTGGAGARPLLEHYPENLFLLRAFTKSYAIPGLRLGYGLCKSPALRERLERCAPCWNISGPAQAAGLACCAHPEWPERGRALVEHCRPALAAGLEALGCQALESRANYLLFRCPDEPHLEEKLLKRGILIRACGNFSGLEPDWYRAAVKTAEENEKLLRAMQTVMEG